jgi:hypothetical protein
VLGAHTWGQVHTRRQSRGRGKAPRALREGENVPSVGTKALSLPVGGPMRILNAGVRGRPFVGFDGQAQGTVPTDGMGDHVLSLLVLGQAASLRRQGWFEIDTVERRLVRRTLLS